MVNVNLGEGGGEREIRRFNGRSNRASPLKKLSETANFKPSVIDRIFYSKLK